MLRAQTHSWAWAAVADKQEFGHGVGGKMMDWGMNGEGEGEGGSGEMMSPELTAVEVDEDVIHDHHKVKEGGF